MLNAPKQLCFARNGIMPIAQQKSHVIANFPAVSRDYSSWL